MANPKVTLAGLTDIGKKRSGNQDSLVLVETKKSLLSGSALIAVADGMGGHAGGEVASALALDSFLAELKVIKKNTKKKEKVNIPKVLGKAVFQSNVAVRQKAEQNHELMGMGTTLTAALITDGEVIFANVGDSRGYIISNGDIRQITKDHSWVGEQVSAGLISEEEAEKHPQRNIITRAIGISENVDVDIFTETLNPGDMVVLCSDGLYPLVSNKEISDQMQNKNLDQICKKLVDLANERGGPDNITVAIARIGGKPKSPDKTHTDKTAKVSTKVSGRKSWIKKLFRIKK